LKSDNRVRLHRSDSFDPEQYGTPVVGIQAEMGDHDSGRHRHGMGQLLFTRQGCIRIELSDNPSLCLLPPTRVAWIPPDVQHRAVMRRTVDYRSIYLSQDVYPQLPHTPRIIQVNVLLRELLERISGAPSETDWTKGKFAHCIALCIDEVLDAQQESLWLPLPRDRRLAALASGAMDPPPLHVLAAQAGASDRTIARLFRRDTGMSYQLWRQQWRLLKAVELLATGHRVTEAASALQFASDSAFITFFKSMTGQTPKAYIGRAS
jgi:AraC-like DNA-binding protein